MSRLRADRHLLACGMALVCGITVVLAGAAGNPELDEWFTLAKKLYQSGDHAQAESILLRIQERNAEYAGVDRLLARVRAAREKARAQDEKQRRPNATTPQSPGKSDGAGGAAGADGDRDARQARAAQAQRHDQTVQRARDLAQGGNYSQAIAEAEKVLAEDPNHKAAKRDIARWREAISAQERQAKDVANRVKVDVLERLAKECLEAKRYSEARRVVGEMQQLDPKDRRARKLLRSIADAEGAQKETEVKNQVEVAIGEANALLAQGQYEAARQKLERVAANQVRPDPRMTTLQKTLQEQMAMDGARREIAQLLSRAEQAQASGKTAEACQLYRDAAALASHHHLAADYPQATAKADELAARLKSEKDAQWEAASRSDAEEKRIIKECQQLLRDGRYPEAEVLVSRALQNPNLASRQSIQRLAADVPRQKDAAEKMARSEAAERSFAQAMRLMKAGKLDEAREILQGISAGDSPDLQAKVQAAISQELPRRAAERRRAEGLQELAKADTLVAERRFDEAISSLNSIRARYPEVTGDADAILAKATSAQAAWKEAEEKNEQRAKDAAQKAHMKVLRDRAQRNLQARQYAAAREAAHQLMSLSPQDRSSQRLLARIADEEKAYQEALRADQIAKGLAEAKTLLGQKRLEQARERLQSLIAGTGESPEVRALLDSVQSEIALEPKRQEVNRLVEDATRAEAANDLTGAVARYRQASEAASGHGLAEEYRQIGPKVRDLDRILERQKDQALAATQAEEKRLTETFHRLVREEKWQDAETLLEKARITPALKGSAAVDELTRGLPGLKEKAETKARTQTSERLLREAESLIQEGKLDAAESALKGIDVRGLPQVEAQVRTLLSQVIPQRRAEQRREEGQGLLTVARNRFREGALEEAAQTARQAKERYSELATDADTLLQEIAAEARNRAEQQALGEIRQLMKENRLAEAETLARAKQADPALAGSEALPRCLSEIHGLRQKSDARERERREKERAEEETRRRAAEESVKKLEADAARREASLKFGLASALARSGKPEKAMPILRELQEKKADLPGLAKLHEEVRLEVEKRAEVLSEYEKKAAASPQDQDSRFVLGYLYLDRGRPQDAVAQYEALTQMAPGDPNHHVNLGYAHRLCGNTDRSETAYRKAIDLAPESAHGYNHLASLYLGNSQRLPEALDLARKAIERAPGNPDVLHTLGYAQFLNGRLDEAVQSLSRAARKSKKDEVQFHYGLALAKVGRTRQAQVIFEHLKESSVDFKDKAEDMLRATTLQ